MNSRTKLLIGLFAVMHITDRAQADDLSFKLPSSILIGATSSSANTKSGLISAHLILPKNFWIDAAFDRAIERTDDLETVSNGTAFTIGTDPLAEFAFDFGVDSTGVQDQYRVQGAKARVTAYPTSVLGVENPGFEVAVDLHVARFSFVNSPNIIFSSTEVALEAKSARLEIAWYGSARWSMRIWNETTILDDRFSDLARPLAPLFIPSTAISSAVSWPGEDVGASVSYNIKKTGIHALISRKTAAVTGDRTGVISISGNHQLTSSFILALRFSNNVVLQSSDSINSDPIQTSGIDATFLF